MGRRNPDPVPGLPNPPLSRLGPAMRACTPFERRCVLALTVTSVKSRAVQLAGSKAQQAKSAAFHVFKSDRVRAAIEEVRNSALLSSSVLAATVLNEAMEHRVDNPALAVRAAEQVLDRTGAGAVSTQHIITQDVSTTEEALAERLRQLVRDNPAYIDRIAPEFRHLLGDLASPRLIEAPVTETVTHEADKDPEAPGAGGTAGTGSEVAG